jgi:hypothetical protein
MTLNLLKLILLENSFEGEKKLKYPHIATELICSSFGVKNILPLVLKDHLDDFFIFLNGNVNDLKPLKQDEPLNAGFLKILFELIKADTEMVLQSYFYKENGVVLLNMLDYIFYEEIDDFYSNIFNYGDLEDENIVNVNDLLIQKLLDMIFGERSENAVSMIDLCLDTEHYEKIILSTETMQKLFKQLLNPVR